MLREEKSYSYFQENKSTRILENPIDLNKILQQWAVLLYLHVTRCVLVLYVKNKKYCLQNKKNRSFSLLHYREPEDNSSWREVNVIHNLVFPSKNGKWKVLSSYLTKSFRFFFTLFYLSMGSPWEKTVCEHTLLRNTWRWAKEWLFFDSLFSFIHQVRNEKKVEYLVGEKIWKEIIAIFF